MVLEPIIEAKDISIEYREFIREKVFSLGRTNVVSAISNISFSVSEGEKVAILGTNGMWENNFIEMFSGKATPFIRKY